MHKFFFATLLFGLLWTIPSLNAATSCINLAEEKESPIAAENEPNPSFPSLSESSSLSTPLTLEKMDSSIVSLSDSIFTVKSSIGSMSKKQRADLVKRLDSKKSELAAIIPKGKIESEIQKDSNCFMFWKIFFKVSARTVGSLAIDIILDLSDGNINGMGVTGPVSYIPHLVEIINATIEEVRNEAYKPKK